MFNDRFPLSYEEAVYLTALRAHVELGEFQDNHYMDYELVSVVCLFVCLFVCLCVCVFVCLFVCLFVC